MPTQRLCLLAAVGLALLAGCASSGKTPKYVTNFDQIRPGMSKSQVSKLLGWPNLVATYPDARTHVAVPDPNDAWSAFKQDVDTVFSEGELWQYGRYNLNDWSQPPELLEGSPKSYIVYFDPCGRVTHCRRATQGPYAPAVATQPYSPRSATSPTPAELWTGDAFGRDKANVGPGADTQPATP